MSESDVPQAALWDAFLAHLDTDKPALADRMRMRRRQREACSWARPPGLRQTRSCADVEAQPDAAGPPHDELTAAVTLRGSEEPSAGIEASLPRAAPAPPLPADSSTDAAYERWKAQYGVEP